jgi:hypothetical protein
MTKRHPNPYRPQLVARAIRKLAADLSYRTPVSRRPLCYAVLERAQAEAVLRVLKGRSLQRRLNETKAETAR